MISKYFCKCEDSKTKGVMIIVSELNVGCAEPKVSRHLTSCVYLQDAFVVNSCQTVAYVCLHTVYKQ